VCWKPCSYCWSLYLLREKILLAPFTPSSLVCRFIPSSSYMVISRTHSGPIIHLSILSHVHTGAHLDFIICFDFLFRSDFCISNTCDTSMLYLLFTDAWACHNFIWNETCIPELLEPIKQHLNIIKIRTIHIWTFSI
jgi:hypothetical protein